MNRLFYDMWTILSTYNTPYKITKYSGVYVSYDIVILISYEPQLTAFLDVLHEQCPASFLRGGHGLGH